MSYFRRSTRRRPRFAKLLGISRQTLHDILTEKHPISPQMALRIGKLCGNGPEIWLRMQNPYDLDVALTELAAEIAAIPTLEAAE